MRLLLSVAKRQHAPFDLAWRTARSKIKMPHPTAHRRAYAEALEETRWAFEFAYNGQDVPGGRGLLFLVELLEDVPDPTALASRRTGPEPKVSRSEAA